MKNSILFLLLAIFSMIWIQACKKEAATAGARVPVLPNIVEKYNEVPNGSGVANPFGTMQITNEKATLGRVLFYETQLSVNNSTSCGSCHNQNKGFATNNAIDEGFNGGMTTRNVPAITNPCLQSSYFWDMSENNLSAMVTQPISNHIEMGIEEPEYMVAKVKSLPYYNDLFIAAFGDANVTSNRIGESLSSFVGSMISVTSKYDTGLPTNFSNFTDQERLGQQLFMVDLPCAGCHSGENFAGWGSMAMNIGLESNYVDPGVPGIDWNTGQPLNGWFKVPSLRNVQLSAPYMHDGRFNTLEEVVEFYNSGIAAHDQLAFNLREGWNGGFFGQGDELDPNVNGLDPVRLEMTQYEKNALVAFLKTLTDVTTISQQKFSDPFVFQQ